MTFTEFEILRHPLARQAVGENFLADPVALAASKPLARTLAELGPGAVAAVATQVKYLQRARTKLPHYYAARCIIPPLAFEQAGSEQTAAHKKYTGETCIDLTCGLGVDSANFAIHFKRVVAVERDPVLAAVARYNFDLLGLDNIEVVNTSAEDYLATKGLKADMIYADPDRRDEANRKLVLLEDCAPDVVALHGRMHEVAPRVVVKASPLFDPPEAFRIFGPHTRVEAVSAGGECKEVLIETGAHIAAPRLAASIAGVQTVEFPTDIPALITQSFEKQYSYLLLPDVSLRRIRMARAAFPGVCIHSENGYAFCDELPAGRMYRAYEIKEIIPYTPRTLARRLRAEGIRSAQLMQRDFPLSNAVIAKQLGIKEGGQAVIAFTVMDGRQFAVLLN